MRTFTGAEGVVTEGGWQYLRGPRAHAPSTSVPGAGAGAPVHQQDTAAAPHVDTSSRARAGVGPMDGIDEGGMRAGSAIAGAGGGVQAKKMSREEMANVLAARMENSTVDFISGGLGRPGGGAPLYGGNYYGQRKLPEEPAAIGFKFGSTGAPGIGGGIEEAAGRRGGGDVAGAGERGWMGRVEWEDGEEAQGGSGVTGMVPTFDQGSAQQVLSEKERKRQELKRDWEEQIALKQRKAEVRI